MIRIFALSALALLAFAGNSLLCRAALAHARIDPASFTTVRLVSGAVTLGFWVWFRHGAVRGSWLSALALFVYAAGFSMAYVELSTAVGALLLFGAVQATMMAEGVWRGERIGRYQMVGIALACAGLVVLLMPGLSAPSWRGAWLMLLAGAAWGVYSLRGKSAQDPLQMTAGNFVRAVPFAMALSITQLDHMNLSRMGIVYAVVSGAMASGLGYALWYAVLPSLKSTTAATVQLAVPAVAAFGGVVLLGEQLSGRLLWACAAILGGIALVVFTGLRAPQTPSSQADGS